MNGSRSGGSDEPTDDTAPSSSESRLYRWTCPYCDKFGIQRASPADIERYVVNAVRSHVRSTDGDGHGPRRDFPPDEDVEAAILDNVEVIASDD